MQNYIISFNLFIKFLNAQDVLLIIIKEIKCVYFLYNVVAIIQSILDNYI